MNLVVPRPCETEPYNKFVYFILNGKSSVKNRVGKGYFFRWAREKNNKDFLADELNILQLNKLH